MKELCDILEERSIDFRKKGQLVITENAILSSPWNNAYEILMRTFSPKDTIDFIMGSEPCKMEIASEEKILSGWLFCDYCGPVYPPVNKIIQKSVKFCPLCGRRVKN